MSDNESEIDIVKYLGLNNTDELAELLSKSTLETLQPGKNFIYNSSHYFEIDDISKNYVSDMDHKDNNPEFSTVRNDEFDLNSIENAGLSESRSHVGWRCVLNYNEKNNGSYDRNNSTYRGIAEKCRPLDCGHILGLGLFQYIEPRQILKKQKSRLNSGKEIKDNGNQKLQEICNNVKYNLFPQFPRANRNPDLEYKHGIGQERFEEVVRDRIKEKYDDKVYYEIEKIYFDSENDEIPVGTRIFASVVDEYSEPNSGKELALPFHVFIPNYAVSDSEWQRGDTDYDLDYLLKNNSSKIRDLYRDFYGHDWRK